MPGRLILAATPIGNLGDISQRLADTLQTSDAVFTEDTRHSRKLLSHLGIKRTLFAFHEHSTLKDLNRIKHRLNLGQSVLYLSDAGMPGISDPGYELVRMAYSAGCEVDVLPGPSSVINALVLSGLPLSPFCFMGFFPKTILQKESLLTRLSSLDMTSIHFEAPQRIETTLNFLADRIPATSMAACREMTKRHQQVLRGSAKEVANSLTQSKGEWVMVIAPIEEKMQDTTIQSEYAVLLDQGRSSRQAIKQLSQKHRRSKRDLIRALENDAP